MGGADAPLRNAELAGLAFADAASDVVAVLPDNSTDAATSKYLTAAHGRSHCGRRVGRVHVRIARLRRRDPLCRTYRHLRQFSKLRPTRPRRHYHPFSKPRPHRRLRYRPPPQTCPSGRRELVRWAGGVSGLCFTDKLLLCNAPRRRTITSSQLDRKHRS